MSNLINYDSWKNKAPFGAIKINQGVRISVEGNENYDLLNVKWIILKDENKIYGIRIDKYDSNPDTRCTYLGDAIGMTPAKMNFETGEFDYGDWADAWFVRDNFPCMLKDKGVIDYKLNPNDYSLKEDGTPSDVANEPSYAGNAMSAMPLVWIWQYEMGDFKYIWLSNYKVNDNYKAYAHQREDGTIAPYVFMSIYKGAIGGRMGENTLCSFSGMTPTYNTYNATEESTLISNWLNTSMWRKKTWFQRNLMQCLITMIICCTNARAKIGMGLGKDYLASDKTGTLDQKGQFYGYNVDTHHMKAFHQEAVWGGAWDRLDDASLIDGIITINDKYKINIPRKYGVNGLIRTTFMTEYGDFPTDIGGTYVTYESAGALLGDLSNTEKCIVVGGASGWGGSNLYNYCDNTTLNSTANIGTSLSCLPLK